MPSAPTHKMHRTDINFEVDGVTPYIDWAVANGYGVVDINFPQLYSTENDPADREAGEAHLLRQTKELVCYIWDNYLELNETASITLMGVGDAYIGIKQLLTSRG